MSCGSLDLEQSAAPIAMLRYMADRLDSDRGKTPMLRYATPASFLSYCDALGLLPPEKVAEAKKGDDGARVVSVVGNSKWAQKKAANG